MTWIERRQLVSGVEARYLEAGSADAPNVVLLLHAFPVGMRLWESQVIPARWRAIAPALPGFDGTNMPPVDSTAVDDYARAAIALLDALSVKAFVVGGVSMGGYAAFGVWRLASARCRGIVLADSRAGADAEPARAARNAMLELVRTGGAKAIADDMLPKLLGETTRAQRPAVASRVRALIESQTPEAIAAAVVRMRDRPDSTALLPSISVPALIVVGAEDGLTPPAEGEKMRAAMPRAEMIVIPGAGHLACMEDASAFNSALGRYLNSVG